MCRLCGADYERRTWRRGRLAVERRAPEAALICPACAQVRREEAFGSVVARGPFVGQNGAEIRRRIDNVAGRAGFTQPSASSYLCASRETSSRLAPPRRSSPTASPPSSRRPSAAASPMTGSTAMAPCAPCGSRACVAPERSWPWARRESRVASARTSTTSSAAWEKSRRTRRAASTSTRSTLVATRIGRAKESDDGSTDVPARAEDRSPQR